MGCHCFSIGWNVYGLKTRPSSIAIDYPGPVFQYFTGISGPPGLGLDTAGIGADAGRTRCVSLIDPMIRGETWYISGSLSVDPLPIADVGAGYLSLQSLTKDQVSYLVPGNANDVDTQKLYLDIIRGRRSAWPIISNPLSGGIPFDWGARIYGVYLAMKYAAVYEELH